MDDSKIDAYRQPWESEDHWKLRKEFIQKYKDQFPEYTLIALSQVHSDTELHGKRFPVPVILPSNQECENIVDENQELGLKVTEERRPCDFELYAEEDHEDDEEQDDAEFLVDEGEEEQEDPEMFVEILDEDYDEPQMFVEKNSGNDSGTLQGQLIQRDQRMGSQEEMVELQDEVTRNNLQKNVDSAYLEGSSGEKEVQFDALSESSNEESQVTFTPANVQQSQLSSDSCAGELSESLKENMVEVFQFVRKLHDEKLNASQILDKLSKKFNVKVECLSEELRKAKCVHVCSVIVDSVLISMGKAPTKKSARRQAINLAVARLMNINWLLVKANFSFSKLSEIVCATKQSSLQSTAQESSSVLLENPSVQGTEFNTVPQKLKDETGWNSSQDILQASGNNLFESSSGQDEIQYDFYGNLEGEMGKNCIMQSSYAGSEGSSGEKIIQGMLPKSFKDSFMDVFEYIRKLHDEKLNSLQVLEKVCKRFNANLEFHSAVFNYAKSLHQCSVEIDGVLISRGKGLTKKNARRDAGKLAVDRLMQLLTRAKLSFSYRCKLSTSAGMSNFDMLGNCNTSDITPRDGSTSNVAYENYSSQIEFDGSCKTMQHSSSDTAMQSSKSMHSVNSYDLDTLPLPLKAKFKQVSQFVRKSLAQKLNPVSIVNNMSQKFKLMVKFKVKEYSFTSHECFLYVNTKVFTKAEAVSERQARFIAAKLAIDRIMEISDKTRNVNSQNSSNENASVGAVVADSGNVVTEGKNGWFAENCRTGVVSNFGKDTGDLYHSNSSVTYDPIVDAYKNSSLLLNIIKYNYTADPEIAPFTTQSSDLISVSQNDSLRQNSNSVNNLNEMNHSANRRSSNENLSRFMVDYPHQNASVRSTYPALSIESGYQRPQHFTSEKSDLSQRENRSDLTNRIERFGLAYRTERFEPASRVERFDLAKRVERFDLTNKTERFDLASRTERFDLANRTERFDIANKTERFDIANKTERFDVANRTERFDLSNRVERDRFDLPNTAERERFDPPNRVERERFDLPNRTERFDVLNRVERERFDLTNRTERFDVPNRVERERCDLPGRTERYDTLRAGEFDLPHKAELHSLPFRAEKHLSTSIISHQNWGKVDGGPKIWLHNL